MPQFSKQSLGKLDTCSPELQELFLEVVKHFDCIVLEGHRGKEAQNKAFASGNSKLKWPHGEHNKFPSNAVDVAPYPLDWNDTKRMYYFAGLVKGIAISKGLKIRFGGDWDGDTEVKDNKFNDLVHFELL